MLKRSIKQKFAFKFAEEETNGATIDCSCKCKSEFESRFFKEKNDLFYSQNEKTSFRVNI